MKSASDFLAIIHPTKPITNVKQDKQISHNFDITPKQIEEYRVLKGTMFHRLKHKEENLKIDCNN